VISAAISKVTFLLIEQGGLGMGMMNVDLEKAKEVVEEFEKAEGK